MNSSALGLDDGVDMDPTMASCCERELKDRARFNKITDTLEGQDPVRKALATRRVGMDPFAPPPRGAGGTPWADGRHNDHCGHADHGGHTDHCGHADVDSVLASSAFLMGGSMGGADAGGGEEEEEEEDRELARLRSSRIASMASTARQRDAAFSEGYGALHSTDVATARRIIAASEAVVCFFMEEEDEAAGAAGAGAAGARGVGMGAEGGGGRGVAGTIGTGTDGGMFGGGANDGHGGGDDDDSDSLDDLDLLMGAPGGEVFAAMRISPSAQPHAHAGPCTTSAGSAGSSSWRAAPGGWDACGQCRGVGGEMAGLAAMYMGTRFLHVQVSSGGGGGVSDSLASLGNVGVKTLPSLGCFRRGAMVAIHSDVDALVRKEQALL
jgi:hypothetical protein